MIARLARHEALAGRGRGTTPSLLLLLGAVERERVKGRSSSLHAKLVPGVLHDRTYGRKEEGQQDLLLAVERRKLQRLVDKVGHSHLPCTYILLEVNKQLGGLAFKERVLPRKLSLDESGSILNFGFVRAPHGVKLVLSAPVRFHGQEKCLGIKEGGFLKQYRRYVSYVCPTDCIPPQVEVDISNLKIGDKIFLSDIKVGIDFYPSEDPGCPVCEIVADKADMLGLVYL